MESSPFNKSSRTVRTPPPTPSSIPAPSRRPISTSQVDDDDRVVTAEEIHAWISAIEQCLNEVCSIATEGKLNSEQKMRISTLCRKVGNDTSHLAVQYQSLKVKTVRAYTTVQNLQDQHDLSQQLTDLKRCIEVTAKPVTGTSFADMVKKGTNDFIKPISLSSVAIYPQDKTRSSEETKSLVQNIICPEKMKLHVRGLRKTRNGGVIISTKTKEDVEKLKQTVQLKNLGLKIDDHIKRKPRIVVIGVPTSLSEIEVFSCLYQQNLAEQLQDISFETFLNSVKLSHKSGKKDADVCNYILEVSATIRRALVSKERLFVNWSSCPVRDFTLVTRCYKCQQYGHAAKTCRELHYTCGHCGEQGHSMKECLRKADEPKCATCLRYRKSSKHNTGAADCPAKLMAETKYINSIDYETS